MKYMKEMKTAMIEMIDDEELLMQLTLVSSYI